MRPAPKITPKFVVAVVEQAREIATEEAILRIPSPAGLAVVLATLILIGLGVMRTGRAQDVPKPTVPPTAPTVLPGTEPGPLQDLSRQAETAPPPVAPREIPESRPSALGDLDPMPQTRPSIELPAEAPAMIAGETDDPEKNVQAFIDQNRKVAEVQLKGLKEESERLRARLQKVEGGIKRWESLLAALEKSSPAVSPKGLTLTDPRVRSSTPGLVPSELKENLGDLQENVPGLSKSIKPPTPR